MIFYKHTVVLCNKPTTIAMNSACGSTSSLHTPGCWNTDCITLQGYCTQLYALLCKVLDYIGVHWIKHVHSL